MAQAGGHLHHPTLNTDGKPHPLVNTLTALTIATAVASLVCVFYREVHIAGVVTGLVGWLTGYAAQMLSATTAQRWVIVPAMVVAATACALNVGHGGVL